MQHQLGETIRRYRKQKGYTISGLADKLGISVGLLSNIETSKTDSFQLNLLNSIIRELDIPISELGLFSNPYHIENLNITSIKEFNKIRPLLEKLTTSFITTFSALSFDESKISLIVDMLIEELKTINQLIETSKSKQ